jgi:hypothetical protein
VHVVVVERGAVKTEMADRGIATASRLTDAMQPEQRDRYGQPVQAAIAPTAASTARGTSAEQAARVIAKAVTTTRAGTHNTIDHDAALLTRLTRIFPDRILDRISAAAPRPHDPTASAA